MPQPNPSSIPPDPLVRNISDTALAVAFVRATESSRPDALFHDPLAERLAGPRGKQIAESSQFGGKMAWALVMRTYLYDQFITEQIRQGVDAVVNLAAGLDARPYRLALPPSLKWIEIDLPALMDYKEGILRDEKPNCEIERVRLDLSDVAARRIVFTKLGSLGQKILIITEGLIVYFAPAQVAALATDLASVPTFQRWLVDPVSPGLLRMVQKGLSDPLKGSGAVLQFGPSEGPDYFVPYGWKPLQVREILKTAARFRRVSLFMRLLALLPSSNGRQGSRPWSAVVLLGKPGT